MSSAYSTSTANGRLNTPLARRPEPEEVLAARRPVALTTAASLGAVAALHLAWAAGSSWPAADRAALAEAFDMPDVPGRAPATLVAGLLAAAAALTAARVYPGRGRIPVGVVDAGVNAAAGVLLTRAVLGLAGDAIGLRSARFRRLDATLYAPVCLALAAGMRRAARG